MMKIKGVQSVEVDVSENAIAHALAGIALRRCGIDPFEFDDAGCEWKTTKDGVYINGDKNWNIVEGREDIVALVDAMNSIFYKKPLKMVTE
jgi:hypothetical protein